MKELMKYNLSETKKLNFNRELKRFYNIMKWEYAEIEFNKVYSITFFFNNNNNNNIYIGRIS